MKKKKTRIVELVISDDSQELTIDAISLVSSPAIEEDFVFFGKEKNNLTLAKVDEEKRMLVSPALIPNKQIYRYDANTDSDYYVYFSKETVAQAAALYLKHNNHHKATYQHEDRVSGVLTIESWIKEGEQDKSNLYGFDLPVGTWFVKMKIENDELWQEIKNGTLKGLSIEGYFVDKMEKMSKTITDEQIRAAYKELQAEGKVKVELGLAKDATDLANELSKYKEVEAEIRKKAGKSYKTIVGEKSNVSKVLQDSENAIKDFEKTGTKAEKVIKELERASKELGISLDKLKPYGVLKDALKKSTEAARDISRQMAYLEPTLRAINTID